MTDALSALALARKSGVPKGLASICSAHPRVLSAAFRHAAKGRAPVLVEATCNQVNQDGGYTGMTPADFRKRVEAMAAADGVSVDRLVLGGDHLGPNPWTKLPANVAMDKACAMVAAYVAAGFGKIHLDASMACADDPVSLPEAVIAERAAKLAAAAETAARAHGLAAPRYVIGTEVPPPGGARERIDTLEPTSVPAAEATIVAHEQVFARAGLSGAFERVIAIVVQPGVEFGSENVVAYDPARARHLGGVLDRQPRLVFEAHSTDYQSRASLRALVRDGFAILKVGPGLTFALREALYALDAIDAILRKDREEASLPDTMDAVMRAEPGYWRGHYHGDERRQFIDRHFSYSDRIRYYWQDPVAMAAVDGLLTRLRGVRIPETLISQFFPDQLEIVRAQGGITTPDALIEGAIASVLDDYAFAA
jgi:D-tagatose 6-phosphate 4-epimerase